MYSKITWFAKQIMKYLNDEFAYYPDPKTEGDFVFFRGLSESFRRKFTEDVEGKCCQGFQTISISVMILEQIAK